MKKDSFAWRLLLGDPPGPQRELVPGEMREFSVFTENGVEHRVWRGHPECGADFTVEITLAPRPDGLFAARFAFRGYAGKAHVEEIRFPSYREPAGPGTRVLAGCHALGGIFELEYFRDDPGATRDKPLALKNTATSLNAILHPDGTGVYFDLRDPVNRIVRMTEFWLENGEIWLEYVHYQALGETPADTGEVAFDCVTGDFTGSWYEAAQIYREWAVKQRWATARTSPSPLREYDIWLWNRGARDRVVPPTLQLQKDLGEDAKVALDWYWWHSNPYDTDYPNYWPPREGEAVFREGVRACRERGVYTQVYMNGVCWDMDTWNWREGGEEGVVVQRDGTPHAHAFNCYTHHRLAWQCGTSARFQARIREQVRHLHDAGLSGQYLDMIGVSTDCCCYHPGHPHRPGGGGFIVDGFRKMIGDIRNEFGPEFALTTEEPTEQYMDLLDGGITLYTSVERMYCTPYRHTVPVFPAVYHGRNAYALFGNYALPDGIPPWDPLWPDEDRWQEEEPWHRRYPHQFTTEFARCIVWGIAPMVCNFTERIYTDPEFRPLYDFILEGAKFFRREKEFLYDGRMLSPEGFECPEHRVEFMCRFIFTKREDFRTVAVTLPKILHGVWESPDGRRALFLVNCTEEPVPWQYGDHSGELAGFGYAKIPL